MISEHPRRHTRSREQQASHVLGSDRESREEEKAKLTSKEDDGGDDTDSKANTSVDHEVRDL